MAIQVAYLAECLKYPFHFFRAAPVSHWHKFFRSTHRIACSCAVAACALENSGNMWEKNSLRSRFKAWGKSRQNDLAEARRTDAPPSE